MMVRFFGETLSDSTADSKEIASKYRDNAVLVERSASMERLAEIQRVNYENALFPFRSDRRRPYSQFVWKTVQME
jgi:hypothetical protein